MMKLHTLLASIALALLTTSACADTYSPSIPPISEPDPITCSAAVLTFDLIDDEAEIAAVDANGTTASVFDAPGGTVTDTADLGDHAVVSDGPECASYPGGEGVQWWELTGIGWLPEFQLDAYVPPDPGPPPVVDPPVVGFEADDPVWRISTSPNGNLRAEPGGALLCAVATQTPLTILTNDFGSCDQTSGEECYEQLGATGGFFWWDKVRVEQASGTCPDQQVAWIGNDQIEAQPAPPATEFAIGAGVRPIWNGAATVDVFATLGSPATGTQPAGAFGVVSGARVFFSADWYEFITFANGVSGYTANDGLQAAAAPGNLFSVGATVEIITATSNVRATPAGTIVDTAAVGVQAVVLAGPVYAEGISGFDNYWYQLDLPIDGWVGNNRLQLSTGGPPPDPDDPSIVPPTADTTITVSGCALTGGSGSTASLGNAISAAPSGTVADPHVTRIVLPGCTLNFGSAVTLPTFSDRTKEIVIDNGPNQGTWNRTAAAQINFTGPSMGTTATVQNFTHVGDKLQLTLASVPASCAAGGIAKFYSLNDPVPGARLSSTGANNSRMGELFEIESVTSTTILMTGPLTTPSRWTNSSATLRVACRSKSSRVWLMDARNDGSENFLAPHLNFTRLDDLRVIRPWHRRNGRQYIFLNFTWRALVYDPDIGIGRADTNNSYWARGIEDRANKHTLVACTGTKINGFDHRHFYDTTGTVNSPSTPDAYGTEYFGTARDCILQDMRASYMSQHEGSVGYRYEGIEMRDTNKNGSVFCVTHRASGVVDGKSSMADILCDTERGIQDGVAQFDGEAGDLDCENCILTTNEQRWTVNTAQKLPGSISRLIDSQCNGTVSSFVQKIGSNPGC